MNTTGRLKNSSMSTERQASCKYFCSNNTDRLFAQGSIIATTSEFIFIGSVLCSARIFRWTTAVEDADPDDVGERDEGRVLEEGDGLLVDPSLPNADDGNEHCPPSQTLILSSISRQGLAGLVTAPRTQAGRRSHRLLSSLTASIPGKTPGSRTKEKATPKRLGAGRAGRGQIQRSLQNGSGTRQRIGFPQSATPAVVRRLLAKKHKQSQSRPAKSPHIVVAKLPKSEISRIIVRDSGAIPRNRIKSQPTAELSKLSKTAPALPTTSSAPNLLTALRFRRKKSAVENIAEKTSKSNCSVSSTVSNTGLTIPAPFTFSTESRAEEREVFEALKKVKELENQKIKRLELKLKEQQAKKEISLLRKTLVPKAQAIRNYPTFEVTRSDKQPTIAESPQLGYKRNANYKKYKEQ